VCQADRRAILLAEAFGVGEDTVRLWRSAARGIDALSARVASGPRR
jgi:hypothetical protein